MNKWISVKEKLPLDDQTVLGWQKGRFTSLPLICYYDEEDKAFYPLFTWQEMAVIVDFWMPLPKPPEYSREKLLK